MSFPTLRAGMVIRYADLWQRQAEAGSEEGRKDRPCAVLLAVATESGGHRVYALPITHSPPHHPSEGVEIPASTKQRLGLDERRSWIVLTEANRFEVSGQQPHAPLRRSPLRERFAASQHLREGVPEFESQAGRC